MTLQKSILAVFISLSLVTCARAEAKILVDAAHSQMGQSENADPPEYVVAPSKVLLVDVSQYKFEKVGEFSSPNTIQLVVSKDQVFSAPFDPKLSVHRLDVTTLEPLRGGKFSGLPEGKTRILAIGYQGPGENAALKVMWVGLIAVKKAP